MSLVLPPTLANMCDIEKLLCEGVTRGACSVTFRLAKCLTNYNSLNSCSENTPPSF